MKADPRLSSSRLWMVIGAVVLVGAAFKFLPADAASDFAEFVKWLAGSYIVGRSVSDAARHVGV